MINLFIDAIKTIAESNLNKDIMRTFSRILSDNKLPKEAILNKFQDIVYSVFSSCDHYESSAMPDVKYYYYLICYIFSLLYSL
jgi:hypothetical protein